MNDKEEQDCRRVGVRSLKPCRVAKGAQETFSVEPTLNGLSIGSSQHSMEEPAKRRWTTDRQSSI